MCENDGVVVDGMGWDGMGWLTLGRPAGHWHINIGTECIPICPVGGWQEELWERRIRSGTGTQQSNGGSQYNANAYHCTTFFLFCFGLISSRFGCVRSFLHRGAIMIVFCLTYFLLFSAPALTTFFLRFLFCSMQRLHSNLSHWLFCGPRCNAH